jgi:hypothetical protein
MFPQPRAVTTSVDQPKGFEAVFPPASKRAAYSRCAAAQDFTSGVVKEGVFKLPPPPGHEAARFAGLLYRRARVR